MKSYRNFFESYKNAKKESSPQKPVTQEDVLNVFLENISADVPFQEILRKTGSRAYEIKNILNVLEIKGIVNVGKEDDITTKVELTDKGKSILSGD